MFFCPADCWPSRLRSQLSRPCSTPTTALGWNLYPRADQTPFWLGINGVEIITSFLDSGLINMVFGSSIVEYIAYLIRGAKSWALEQGILRT